MTDLVAPTPTATLLGEARQELTLADQKLSIILATVGVSTAVAAGVATSNSAAANATWPPTWTLAAASVLAVVAATACATGLWPRTHRRGSSGPITYWGDAAHFASPELLGDHITANPVGQEARDTTQLWQVATILNKKYRSVRLAIICLSGAILALIAGAMLS
jgi:hypothetical protein